MAANRSKIVKNAGRHGIEPRGYKPDDGRHLGVTRRTLIGDAPDETASSFVTRVFEIAPGGYSTLERHDHPHTVLILEGSGSVILDRTAHPVCPLDCVYVAPRSLHQFQAHGERLVFLCIVDRDRDRPQVASIEEIRELRASGVPVRAGHAAD